MSIILDALNKADKERSSPGQEREENFNPVIEPEKNFPQKRGWPRLLPYTAFPVLALILAGLLYRSPLFEKGKSSISSEPSAPLVNNESDREKAEKIKTEAMELFKKGKMEESARKWEKAVSLNPQSAELQNNLGVALKKAGKKEEAKLAYEKALSLRPDYAEALNNLGALLMEGGNSGRAADLFSRAIEAREDYAEPHFHLALLLEKEGNKTEAISHYETFLVLSPDIASTLKSQVEFRILKLK